MSRQDPQFNLRLPADLKAQIEASAQQNGRSMTAEIIEQLRAIYRVQTMLKNAHEDEQATLSPEEAIRAQIGALKMHANQIDLIRQDIERYLGQEKSE